MVSWASDRPEPTCLGQQRRERHQPRALRVSRGVVTQFQQILARRPVLDLVFRVVAIALLALLILVVLPALATLAG